MAKNCQNILTAFVEIYFDYEVPIWEIIHSVCSPSFPGHVTLHISDVAYNIALAHADQIRNLIGLRHFNLCNSCWFAKQEESFKNGSLFYKFTNLLTVLEPAKRDEKQMEELADNLRKKK